MVQRRPDKFIFTRCETPFLNQIRRVQMRAKLGEGRRRPGAPHGAPMPPAGPRAPLPPASIALTAAATCQDDLGRFEPHPRHGRHGDGGWDGHGWREVAGQRRPARPRRARLSVKSTLWAIYAPQRASPAKPCVLGRFLRKLIGFKREWPHDVVFTHRAAEGKPEANCPRV